MGAAAEVIPSVALRSRIVLKCAAGLSNKEVAEAVGVTATTVGKWRSRFCELRLDGLSMIRGRAGRRRSRPGRSRTCRGNVGVDAGERYTLVEGEDGQALGPVEVDDRADLADV